MNVLFLMGRMLIAGGVEKITIELANSLQARGINVSIICFEIEDEDKIKTKLADGVELFVLSFPVGSKNNKTCFKDILKKKKIDFIVNQWAVPWYVTKFIRQCTDGTNVRLISVHHSLPNNNSKITAVKGLMSKSRCLKPLYGVLLNLITFVSKRSLRKVYQHSDRFILLSPSFIPLFKDFIGISDANKVSAIPNFIKSSDIGECTTKTNEIICVGRVDYNSKCTYRIVEIWQQLESKFPDWSVTVVGDGPDFDDLKQRVEASGLNRLNLTGYANPLPYYRRSKILLHLSEYEGFGLVILEAMCNGTVPVVLNSFATLSDLIRNNDMGIKLSYPYDENQAVSILSDLMRDNQRINFMSRECKSIYNDFSEETIVNLWISLFNSLTKQTV
ncbi:MAG: glycosyltransferase family 4 protein [Barnesiella sp.]|nr:glycosyltransferase family 4 protein [Barnesiella sp.]